MHFFISAIELRTNIDYNQIMKSFCRPTMQHSSAKTRADIYIIQTLIMIL